MNSSDLDKIKSIQESLSNPLVASKVSAVVIDNPAVEVEKALVGFLKHQLTKLQDNTEYEVTVKDALITRLAEASFPQLLSFLDILQRNNNEAMQKVLAPFIAHNSDRTLLDSARESSREKEAGDVVYSETNDKEVLQGMQALSQFLQQVQKTIPPAADSEYSIEETDEELD